MLSSRHAMQHFLCISRAAVCHARFTKCTTTECKGTVLLVRSWTLLVQRVPLCSTLVDDRQLAIGLLKVFIHFFLVCLQVTKTLE